MGTLSMSDYYELDELKSEWGVDAPIMKKWLTAGELKTGFWLPIISVYSSELPQDPETATEQLEHYEGFVPLNSSHCQRLYRCGRLTIRRFTNECGTKWYHLPDSTDDICISAEDLLILRNESERFQSSCDSKCPCPKPGLETTDFRELEIDGKCYYFGEKQSEILRLLHEAALDGQPWQNGKQLLHQVGSESFTLSNVFKHKPIWKELIQSNKRGAYRLKERWTR